MERNVCICVSLSSFDPTSTAEGSDGTMIALSLSQIVLVSSSTGAPGGYSKNATYLRRHANKKKRSHNACKSRVTKSCSMENFKSASSKRRFSPKAEEYIKQARRASTQRMYQERLAIYRSWCNRRHVSPFSASVEELANFFIYLH
jgi:hypothetical protein